MIKLPVVSAKELIKVLSKLGYYIDNQKGSHIILAHPCGRTITVINQSELKKSMLKRILKDVKLTNKEFILLLRCK